MPPKPAAPHRGNAYGYKQAYKNSPSATDLTLLHHLLEAHWGKTPTVLDPTAGGGSIPFQAVRYRLPSHANDLNSVAASVLRTGIELPARYGRQIIPELERWGDVLVGRLETRLTPFFKSDPALDPARTYIWAPNGVMPPHRKDCPSGERLDVAPRRRTGGRAAHHPARWRSARRTRI